MPEGEGEEEDDGGDEEDEEDVDDDEEDVDDDEEDVDDDEEDAQAPPPAAKKAKAPVSVSQVVILRE